ncbi:uncharacterized protein FOMMEDRAFT_162737 [Fomitiporia mediterranea MF3/22]|uniref:BZIP domain-containing protein n=1 Tax=Fomitiporia mediterranea (strain MF3/22) TaxID=694068 RepID=R7SJD9_FOMME|nr:uncharacterized protein FOMMEDRAFT_162737 [Fomitiporia mediterranea MF3/22]EJC97714.1 hypothetical protein FOMMEDRAFT_162737 [Fomitiporia mediterranea MF3/22]
MPKTPQSQPPSPVKQPANAPAPDKLDKMSEITLRKKNADAQAAFRARRANYIATLEETGPSAAKYLNIHVPTTKCPIPYPTPGLTVLPRVTHASRPTYHGLSRTDRGVNYQVDKNGRIFKGGMLDEMSRRQSLKYEREPISVVPEFGGGEQAMNPHDLNCFAEIKKVLFEAHHCAVHQLVYIDPIPYQSRWVTSSCSRRAERSCINKKATSTHTPPQTEVTKVTIHLTFTVLRVN